MAKDSLFRRGTFRFVGEQVYGRDNVLVTAKMNAKSEWSRTRLNFGVKVDNNTQFLTTEYIHSDKVNKVKLFDKEGKGFEIPWADTIKESTLKKVAEYNKITVNLETNKEIKDKYYSLVFRIRNHEMKETQTQEDLDKIKEYTEELKEYSSNVYKFAHMKDVINFINDKKEEIKGHRIKVTGDVKSNYYKDKNNLQYIPQSIELVTGEVENELTVNLDIFFNKDSLIDDEEGKKMYVNGYVGDRIKKADKLIPTQILFDYTKADLENEQQKGLVNFVKGFFFEIEDEDYMYKLPVVCTVVNGAEIVEFDENSLTDRQKMAIMMGMNKIEDFKPKGSIYGNKVSFIKVVRPDLKLAPNGATQSFLYETLPTYMLEDESNVSINKVKEEKEEKNENKELSAEEMMSKLFG